MTLIDKYNPDQARDDHGRWADEGGGRGDPSAVDIKDLAASSLQGPMTAAEEAAVQAWLDYESFEEVQISMRETRDMWPIEEAKDFRDAIRRSKLSQDVVLYRGVAAMEDNFGRIPGASFLDKLNTLEPNDVITDFGFMATSLGPGAASEYGEVGTGQRGAMMVIRAKKGDVALPLPKSSWAEVVFHNGTRLVFVEKRPGNQFVFETDGIIPPARIAKYDPDQERDDHGRWTSGGASESESAAFARYSHSGYRTLNAALRRGEPPADLEMLAELDTFTQRSVTNQELVVYRALDARGATAQRLMQLQPGDVVTDPAFMSVAAEERGAENFARSQADEAAEGGGTEWESVQTMEIVLPKGTRFGATGGHAVYQDEAELLLPRGSRLRVTAPPRPGQALGFELLPSVKKYDPDQARDEQGRWSNEYGSFQAYPTAPRGMDLGTEPTDRNELYAVKDYTGDDFKYINAGLRADQPPESFQEDWAETIAHLDRFTERGVTTKPVEVYRVISWSLMANIQVGDILTDPGFMSTAADMEGIETYAGWEQLDNAAWGKVPLAEISVPKGTRFGPAYRYAPEMEEKELLFPRGTKLQYTGIAQGIHGFKMIPPVKKYSEEQPRDDHGRWTSGGGGGATLEGYTQHAFIRDGKLHTTEVEDALRALHENRDVVLTQPEDVATLMDELKKMTDDAVAKGTKAPNYDLCRVSVEGSNLFCAETKGIPRVDMPQFGGIPMPGSKADALPNKGPDGGVDITEHFEQYLREKGYAVTAGSQRVDYLRATQNELSGPKVAGIFHSMEQQGILPGVPLFTSRDDYIVDGHHRWAAAVGLGYRPGKDVPEFEVLRVDADIIDILHEARVFTRDWGMPQIAMGKRWRHTLAAIEAALKYDEDQPRDEFGRWTDSGGHNASDMLDESGDVAAETTAAFWAEKGDQRYHNWVGSLDSHPGLELLRDTDDENLIDELDELEANDDTQELWRLAEERYWEEMGPHIQVLHGTTTDVLDSIAEKGIIPQGGEGADAWLKDNQPSVYDSMVGDGNKGATFVTDDARVARDFAYRVAGHKENVLPVVVVAQIPTEEFKALASVDPLSHPDNRAIRLNGAIKPIWLKQAVVLDDDGEPAFTVFPRAGKAKGKTLYVVMFLEKGAKKYDESQPRDDHGRWSDEGGDFAGDKIVQPVEHQAVADYSIGNTLITPDEARAVAAYSGSAYVGVNRGLRKGIATTGYERQTLADLDKLFERVELDRDLTTFRYVGSKNTYEKFVAAVGGQIVDKGFVSTSADLSRLVDPYRVPGGVLPNANRIIKIEIPAGAKALPIAHMSMAPHETEVLINRGSTFSVRKDAKGIVLRWVS